MPEVKGSRRWRRAVVSRKPSNSWIDQETEDCTFVDERLGKRFRRLLEQLSDGAGETIPMACQDWANTKAAYRFFDNERVNERDILAGHFQSTRQRFLESDSDELVLVLHDTTEFCFHRNDISEIGKLTRHAGIRTRPTLNHTVCGLLMHSSLVVTPDGLPLGLSAVKFWTRDEFKGTNALKKHINPTRVPIEKKESFRWLQNLRESTDLLSTPERCVHVGDRESDIYELFCTAKELGTHFVFRTCVDRLAGDGEHTVADEMQEVDCKGLHRIEVINKKGVAREVVIELRYRRILVLPPIGKQRLYPALELTVLHAKERDARAGYEPIDWKLITDLPVRTRLEAIEKINWYALRWKMETFHKIMKSGCKTEESKLRTAERLVNLIATFCIMSWRIFWMTMINRSNPDAAPGTALTRLEVTLLDRLVKDKDSRKSEHKTLIDYLTKIARLGGYLARKKDPPPGNMVMWRGLARLTDIELGFILAGRNVDS